MHNRVLLTALTASLLGLGTAHAHGDRDPNKLFDALDGNGDGQLSASELENMHEIKARQRFQRADENGNGKIDKEEFMARAEARAERLFGHMDRDDDGAITAEEAKPPYHGKKDDGPKHGKKHRFDPMKRMDANDDGVISRDEWRTAVEKFHAKHRTDGDS